MNTNEEDENYDPYSDVPEPEIYWCLHCERTYRKPLDLRGRLVCPYDKCHASNALDGFDWEAIREGNPGYPEIPEEGVCYPMYGDESEST